MTILADLDGTVTVTDALPSLAGAVEVTDTDFWIELTVDDRAAVAFAERFQRLGVRIQGDRGDGAMVTFPDREVAAALVIEEDADDYGDKLTFRLAGERFSPFARAWLRSKRKVRVYFSTGSPWNEFTKLVFTGWVMGASYQLQPASSDVRCLDAAGLYSERRARSWTLAPGSNRTRLSIVIELLAIGGIPVKSINLPGGDGGRVNKPRTLGDTTILDFLRDFLGVLGVEIGFVDGGFVAHLYDRNAPSVATLHPGNMVIPASLEAPETLAPNVTGVVAVSFSSTDPSGLRVEEVTVVTTGLFAPQVYAFKQVGDVLTANPAAAETPVLRVISEVVTKTTFYGSLDVRTEETVRGWYAPRAAGQRVIDILDPPGYEVENRPDQVFIFPDGSTRAESREQFRIVSKSIRTKELDDDNNVVATREEKYFFHFLTRALWLVDEGEDVYQSTGQYRYVNDEGDVLVTEREVMGLFATAGTMEGGTPASSLFSRPDALTEMAVELNSDGAIISEASTEHAYSTGDERRRADGAWGYGIESRTYTNRQAETYAGAADEWGGLTITTKRYRSIDEDRYVMTEIFRDGNAPPITRETRTIIGSLPRPERAEPTTSSQEIRAIVKDAMRVTFAGEEIEAVEQNEYIETQEEAATYARFLARKAAAVKLSCAVPIETLIHKWSLVTVRVPGATIDGLKFEVRSVSRDAATFRESIEAAYYPPSLT